MNNNSPWNEEDDIDLRKILLRFLSNWYWFAIATVISLLAARYHLDRLIPVYRVSSTLLIKDKSSGTDNVVDMFDVSYRSSLDNELEIIRSRPVLEKVVASLGLDVKYWQEGDTRDRELYTDSPITVVPTETLIGEPFCIKPLPGGKYELWNQDKRKLLTPSYGQKVKSRYGKFRVFPRDSLAGTDTLAVMVSLQNKKSVVNGLIGAISVDWLNENSTLISLSISDPLPLRGEKILSSTLEEYSLATLEDKNREVTNTLRFIDDRLKIVAAELGSVEQNVKISDETMKSPTCRRR